jgi:hypothetical protein
MASRSSRERGDKTGWPPGLLQDDCRSLSRWFAVRPDARRRVRERCAEIRHLPGTSRHPPDRPAPDPSSPATERGFFFLKTPLNKPAFITFTGIDAATDFVAARALSAAYPVEFAVLFSPERQGENPRYPAWGSIHKMLDHAGPGSRFAAHLCGGHSRLLLATASTMLDPMLRDHFSRVQINTAYVGIDPAAIAEWAESIEVQPILQCRETFPLHPEVSWLFDASGGRGKLPEAWPAAPRTLSGVGKPPVVGYAGGLSPHNIAEQLPLISAAAGDSPYWIDMESGVRTDDRFDLVKCRAVCDAVYR